jgi:hypothetical protein
MKEQQLAAARPGLRLIYADLRDQDERLEAQGSGVFRECHFLSYSRQWRRRASAGVVWSRRPSGTCR